MMNASSMANAIRNSGIQNCKDASSALQMFWNAVCIYVSNNLEATYSWIGANPESGAIDPVVILKCKAVAAGTLHPCKLNNANAALSAMSIQMNTSAATWTIIPDIKTSPGFTITPGFIIPTIKLSTSNITEPSAALEFMCNKIITGIKKATPILTGAHAAFVGTATLVSII